MKYILILIYSYSFYINNFEVKFEFLRFQKYIEKMIQSSFKPHQPVSVHAYELS